MNDKITVRVQAVEVERGRDVIVTQVPEHEVEVLRTVHGPENVRVIDEHADDMDLDGSAEQEIMRLQNVYKRVNAPDPVRFAFPNGPRDLVEHGFGRGSAKAAPMSHVVDHKKAARAAEKKPAK